MTPSVDRKRTILALLVALGLIAAFAWLPATAAPVKKIYTATIESIPAASAGTSSHYTLTLTNSTASNQSFGSADIIIPTTSGSVAFTGISSIVATAPGTKMWSGALNGTGTKINMRSPSSDGTSVNSISPGQSVVLRFDATAPCTTGPYTWVTQVKQSNNFQGALNDFTLSGSAPTTTVSGFCAGPPSKITFDTAPSSSISAGDTFGSFTVKVTDAQDHMLNGVAVTVSSPGISASAIANTNAGIATFTGVTAVTSTAGYTMTASAASGTPATAPFTVQAPDISVTKVADSTSIHATEVAGFTITVSNAGPGDALGVVATDTLPTDSGLDWSIASDPGGDCAIASGILTCTIPRVSAGSNYAVHITSPATTATVADSPISNRVSVTVGNGASPADASASIFVGAGVLGCGETATETPGGVVLDRGTNNGGPACVPIDYTVTRAADHVTFLKDLSQQATATFTMSITWDAEAAVYPLTRTTRIDFGTGEHAVLWCDGTPLSPVLPGPEKVCLTAETPVWLGGGQVQVTSNLYIEGDLLIKH